MGKEKTFADYFRKKRFKGMTKLERMSAKEGEARLGPKGTRKVMTSELREEARDVEAAPAYDPEGVRTDVDRAMGEFGTQEAAAATEEERTRRAFGPLASITDAFRRRAQGKREAAAARAGLTMDVISSKQAAKRDRVNALKALAINVVNKAATDVTSVQTQAIDTGGEVWTGRGDILKGSTKPTG